MAQVDAIESATVVNGNQEKVVMDQATIDAAAAEGSYELLLTGFGGLGADPDQLRRNFAGSSQTGGFSRALGYHNAEFDRWTGSASRTSR